MSLTAEGLGERISVLERQVNRTHPNKQIRKKGVEKIEQNNSVGQYQILQHVIEVPVR